MENIMTEHTPHAAGPDASGPHGGPHHRPPRFHIPRHIMRAGVVAAVLVAGVAAGAGAQRYLQRSQPQSVLLLQPAPIAQMSNDRPVAVKGQVAEIYGNKFIIQDDSGRALVETGPRGDNRKLVEKGQTVTIQGRFDRGFIHAQVMTRADGTSEAFGPPKPPHHEPRRGPHDDRGPDRGPGAGPDRDPGRAPPPRPPAP
jgi:uncharacterized protein YdeI (BOF family)